MWWLRLGHNYTHLTSSMELLWLILLHITCVTHHPGNGEMNLAVATELQLHTCDPETCGLELILIVGRILVAYGKCATIRMALMSEPQLHK